MEFFTLESGQELHVRAYNSSYQHTFKWTIENISIAPIFLAEKTKQPVESRENVEYFSLYLCQKANVSSKVNYKVHISDCNDQILYQRTRLRSLSSDQNTYLKPSAVKRRRLHISDQKEQDEFHIYEEIKRYKKEPNDQLTFTLLLKVEMSKVTVDMNQFLARANFYEDTLSSKDLKYIFENNNQPDVTLSVDDNNIVAHKTILSVRSEVFNSMLKQNHEEKPVISFDDTSLFTLNELLRFMYWGLLVDYDFDKALKVYRAADKYIVTGLRDICRSILVDRLTPHDVHHLLRVAEMSGDQILKEKVQRLPQPPQRIRARQKGLRLIKDHEPEYRRRRFSKEEIPEYFN